MHLSPVPNASNRTACSNFAFTCGRSWSHLWSHRSSDELRLAIGLSPHRQDSVRDELVPFSGDEEGQGQVAGRQEHRSQLAFDYRVRRAARVRFTPAVSGGRLQCAEPAPERFVVEF
jgi:hypothetical protein